MFFLKHGNHAQKVCSDSTYVCIFMLLVFVLHSFVFNDIYDELLYYYTNDVLLKVLGIHYIELKKYDFFVFLQNEGIIVATLDVKREGLEASDSNTILALSVAT